MFAGFVSYMEEERLPRRVMFGELVGSTGYSGGQEEDWMVRLEKDMTDFGVQFGRWRKADRRPADGFDGSRRGRRDLCGNCMTGRAVEFHKDT